MIDTILYALLHLSPLTEVLLKVSVLLLMGWAASLAMERFAVNPRWRVLSWRAVAAGCVLLPLLALRAPDLKFGVSRQSVENAEARGMLRTIAMEELAAMELQFDAAVDEAANAPVLQSEVNDLRRRVAENPPIAETSTSSAVVNTDGASTSWYDVIVMLYLGGVIFLTFRFVLRQFLVLANLRDSQAAPTAIEECAREIATRLGLRRVPQLRVSDGIASPYLAGVFRPVVVLSSRVARAENRRELQSVLAHELAHQRGADVPWSLLVELLGIALWFHPLVWKISAAHSGACEESADLLAADCMGGERIYSAVLARVALDVLGGPAALRGTVPMARTPEIRKRLQRLKSRKGNGIMRKALVVPAGCLFFSLLIAIACTRVVTADSTPEKTDTVAVTTTDVHATAPSVGAKESAPPAPPVPPAPPAPPVAAMTNLRIVEGNALKKFSVEVDRYFGNEAAAQPMLAQLQKEGYLARIVKVGQFLRVRVGHDLLSMTEATTMAKRLRDELGISANVVLEESSKAVSLGTHSMNDAKFMVNPVEQASLPANTLRAAIFSLEPESADLDTPEKKSRFVAQVREVVETLLYADGGKVHAEAEGRKSWYDENNHRLTITARQDQIQAVREYLASLPELKQNKSPKKVSFSAGSPELSEKISMQIRESRENANKRAEEAAKRAEEAAQRALDHVRRQQDGRTQEMQITVE
ncbi:M48 family metalloprotease [Candidatus Sumerlaeota bacterium]|nr:M48 family metalloprotease [Candidatus Sumerlaeota bacterium]